MFRRHVSKGHGTRALLIGGAVVMVIGLATSCVQIPPSDNSNGNANANENVNDNTNGNSGLTGKYVGAERCSECHVTLHRNWSDTLHAKALETLEGIGQGSNAECLPCHTAGFGESGGFVDRATTNALAGVQCENCHGPGKDHVDNIEDATLRPKIDISASVCGACHTDAHQPNFEQWSESRHAKPNDTVATEFGEGLALNSCGTCHSGDFRYLAIIRGETVADDLLLGKTQEEMNGTTCAICHNPHQKTGNATQPEDGRDYQLRYPEVASPTPSNTVEDATNPERFNVCGQCHHDRGRTWQSTSRPTHPSNQSNVYVGEMPLPEDTDPLVLSRVSVHSFAPEQCATCHMYRQDFQDENAPAISGHNFTVNTLSCATAGCHPSQAAAEAVKATLQGEIQSRLDDIHTRLGDPATWEYSANGGPTDQTTVSDEIKQARFLYYYALEDGSLGVHNPAYIRDILVKADDILTGEGL